MSTSALLVALMVVVLLVVALTAVLLVATGSRREARAARSERTPEKP